MKLTVSNIFVRDCSLAPSLRVLRSGAFLHVVTGSGKEEEWGNGFGSSGTIVRRIGEYCTAQQSLSSTPSCWLSMPLINWRVSPHSFPVRRSSSPWQRGGYL